MNAKFSMDGPLFKGLVNWMKNIADDVTFDMAEEGWKVNQMNMSHIALIKGTIGNELFNSYEMQKSTKLSLDLEEISKLSLVKGLKKNTTIDLSVEDRFNLAANGITNRMYFGEPSTESPPMPKLEFTAEMRVDRVEFYQIIKSASEIGETILIKATPEKMTIKAYSETSDFEKTILKDDPALLSYSCQKPSKLLLGAAPLLELLNLNIPSANIVTLRWNTDKPFKIEFEKPLDIAAYLAPRIDESAEPTVTVRFLEAYGVVTDDDGQSYGGFEEGEVIALPRSAASKPLQEDKATTQEKPKSTIEIDIPTDVSIRYEDGKWQWAYERWSSGGQVTKAAAAEAVDLLSKAMAGIWKDFGGKLLGLETASDRVVLHVKSEKNREFIFADKYGLPIVEIHAADKLSWEGYPSDWQDLASSQVEGEAPTFKVSKAAKQAEPEGSTATTPTVEEAEAEPEEATEPSGEVVETEEAVQPELEVKAEEEAKAEEPMKTEEEPVKVEPIVATSVPPEKMYAVQMTTAEKTPEVVFTILAKARTPDEAISQALRIIVNARPLMAVESKSNKATPAQPITPVQPATPTTTPSTKTVPKTSDGTLRARKAWIKIHLKAGNRDRAERLAKEIGVDIAEVESGIPVAAN